MIRLLVLLSALAVVVLSQLSKDRPCLFAFYTKGEYKAGVTSCKNATLHCADPVADCMHNYMEKKGPRLCCKQAASVVAPICPSATPTLLNPNKNKNMVTWVPCNPAKRVGQAPCPNGYTCAQATNEFTRIGETIPKYVCCK